MVAPTDDRPAFGKIDSEGRFIAFESGATNLVAGDINGDSYDDFIISAYLNGEHGSTSGQTYLILGKSSGGQPPRWSIARDVLRWID